VFVLLLWSTFSTVSHKSAIAFVYENFYRLKNEFTSPLVYWSAVRLASIKMTGTVLGGARTFEPRSPPLCLAQPPTLKKRKRTLKVH